MALTCHVSACRCFVCYSWTAPPAPVCHWHTGGPPGPEPFIMRLLIGRAEYKTTCRRQLSMQNMKQRNKRLMSVAQRKHYTSAHTSGLGFPAELRIVAVFLGIYTWASNGLQAGPECLIPLSLLFVIHREFLPSCARTLSLRLDSQCGLLPSFPLYEGCGASVGGNGKGVP